MFDPCVNYKTEHMFCQARKQKIERKFDIDDFLWYNLHDILRNSGGICDERIEC